MLLIIDNYDSFVFNLARYVNELDFECVVMRNDAVTVAEIEHQIRPSHIILSPGPCTPNEAGVSLELVGKLGMKIPILGVCLGHQVIGQACGAKVIKARRPMHGKSSIIQHDQSGLFDGLMNPLKVGRYHSLAVSPDDLPDTLHVNAYSDEGDIMAMQHKEWPLFAVQFHPESILTECGHQIISNFIRG
jgi:anthranilate synthase component 2